MTTKTPSLVEQAVALMGGKVDERVEVGGGTMGKAQGPVTQPAQGGGAHAKRPQDKSQGDPMVKPQNPAGTPIQATSTENNVQATADNSASNRSSVAMKSVKEDVDAMFAGQDVSEEFKTKATTIFEAAVGARVAVEKAAIEESTKTQLAEAVEIVKEDLTGKLDDYLTYCTEQWLEKNAIAIESSIRADIAESFMKGLYDLFEEHHIEVPEDKIDVVEELAAQVEELKESLNKAVNESLELKKQVEAAARAKVVAEVTEGVVETQKEKLGSLFESVEFTTTEEFKTKLTTIKDGYVAQSGTKKVSVQNLLEQVEQTGTTEEKKDPITEPQVASYVDALTRTMRK